MARKKDSKIIEAESESKALVPRNKRSLADFSGEWFKENAQEEKEPQIEIDDSNEQDFGRSDDIYQSFARQVARIKRLSDEEERALGKLVQEKNDSAARKKLVLHNMRLALKMAHQYKRDWTNLMDLVQEASAGMAIAAQKWDPDVGTRFGTYAAYWIRAQLTKFLMTNARLIHTANTRAGRKVYFSLPQVRRKLLLEGKVPTVELIAKEVGEDPIEVASIVTRLSGREASLSTPIDDESAATLEDTIAGTGKNPEEESTHNEMQRVIKDVIQSFEKSMTDERDLSIWRENLIANEPVNLVDLGKRFGVSKQRMGQLSTRIKRKFRRHIIDELGPSTQLSWLFRDD